MRDLLDRVKLEKILEGDAVYFNAVNGFAGTTHPIGTPQMPVNNLPDLRTICAARNLKKIFVASNMTLDAAMNGYEFIGVGKRDYTVDLNGKVVTSSLKNLYIEGNHGGGTIDAIGCSLNGVVDNFEGDIYDSIDVNITPRVNGTIYIYNCTDGYIDFTHNPTSVDVMDSHGGWGCENIAVGSHTIALTDGYLFLNNTCVAGTLFLSGDFDLTDESAGLFVQDYRARRFILDKTLSPYPYLLESWQGSDISPIVWALTNPATGVAWQVTTHGSLLVAQVFPNANETARLRSSVLWPRDFGYSDSMIRKMILEFQAKTLPGDGNVDAALSFFGLTPNQGDNRSSDGIIGWAIDPVSRNWQLVSDNAGAETVITSIVPWGGLSKLRIEIGNTVQAWIGDTLLGTILTNVSIEPSYLNFFIDTTVGGAARVDIGMVRLSIELYNRMEVG